MTGSKPFPHGGGRRRIGSQRSVRCDDTEWTAVDRLAALYGVDKTVMARRLIVLGLQTIAEQAKSPKGTAELGKDAKP